MKYYKATRLDGTDFRTGTILYEVGKRTVHPTSTKRSEHDPSTYLSVSTTATDCTGFEWPCRLFRVRGVGQAMKSSYLPNKRAFLALDVVEELPAHMVFGPQGEQVVALIERASRLTAAEAQAVYAARDAAEYAARGAARDVAEYAARGAAGYVAEYAATGAAGYVARALVVRDLIGSHGFTQEHYDLLTGPWRTVIGRIHPDDAELKEE